jgi:hypothetical protein
LFAAFKQRHGPIWQIHLRFCNKKHRYLKTTRLASRRGKRTQRRSSRWCVRERVSNSSVIHCTSSGKATSHTLRVASTYLTNINLHSK